MLRSVTDRPSPRPGAGSPPAERPLRRRRIVVGTGAALAVVAVVVPVALAAGGVVGGGAEPAPTAPTASEDSSEPPFQPGETVPVDVDRVSRELVTEPGVVVDRRDDDVVPGIRGRSAALDLTYEGKRYWVVLAWDDRGADLQWDVVAEEPEEAFEEFVDRYVPRLRRAYGGGSAAAEKWPEQGRVAGLTVTAGVFELSGPGRILDQRRNPRLRRASRTGPT